MREVKLFAAVLGLQKPGYVSGLDLSVSRKRLDIAIDFEAGGLFPCLVCGTLSKADDSTTKSWRHLNFFQHHCLITANVPRVRCPEHGMKRIHVPWAREGSRFTLLFEQVVLSLVREMPVAAAARIVSERDKRLWRIIQHYVQQALESLDLGKLTAFGLMRRHRSVAITM